VKSFDVSLVSVSCSGISDAKAAHISTQARAWKRNRTILDLGRAITSPP
jgi:hypothetical protein